MDRKKRLRAIQLSLSVLGLAIVIFTYVIDKKENLPQENILTENIEKTIKKQIKEDQSKNDIFLTFSTQVLILLAIDTFLNPKKLITIRIIKKL